MIAALLLSSLFMMVILIGMAIVVVQFKKWSEKKDMVNQLKIDELTKRIEDTQEMFKNEISSLLNQIKDLIK